VKLPDSQIKKILIAGGAIFLLIRFRDFWLPKKPLEANGSDKNAVDRAVNAIKNGNVKVATTPDEIKQSQ
jgi:hypothetical protein